MHGTCVKTKAKVFGKHLELRRTKPRDAGEKLHDEEFRDNIHLTLLRRMHHEGSPDSVVGAVNKLQAGRSGVWIAIRAGHFCLLEIVQTGSGVHPASYSMGTGVLPQGKGTCG